MTLFPNAPLRLGWLRAVSSVLRSGGLAVLSLFLFASPFLLSTAHAQAIEAATLLSPWPPPGWPEGAEGEVRLTAGDDPGTLVNVLSFPIEDDGSIVYTLPERLPADLPESVFAPLKPADFAACPEAAPAVSPPGVEYAGLSFYLYAAGELWGTVDMSEELQTGLVTGESRDVIGLFYASRPVAISGSGTCANGIAIRYDIELGEGPRLLLGIGTLNATSYVFTFETTGRFDLSQRPVMFGSE